METKKLTTHPPARVMPTTCGISVLGGNHTIVRRHQLLPRCSHELRIVPYASPKATVCTRHGAQMGCGVTSCYWCLDSSSTLSYLGERSGYTSMVGLVVGVNQ
jgi:hypothetical protein